MAAWSSVLRRCFAHACLAGVSVAIHKRLGGCSGPREFRRVAIVSALRRNNGIASGALLQSVALRMLGVEVELLDATAALRNPFYRVQHRPASVYIFHSGGPQLASLIASVMPHAAHAYRIGYWAWELPDPPRDWSGCDRNVAELWTPSAFSRASLERLVARRLEVVPHYVPAEVPRRRNRGEPFTVLTMADGRSSWSRKNPEGAVRAFQHAFGESCSAKLLLKLGGHAEDVDALLQSLGELRSGGNIEVIRGHLGAAELTALYRRSDVLLSLHRAEGYGLPMHEAMVHGVPVVATGWSGNLDFMSCSDSCLVPYELVPVADASAIYSNSYWADPDLLAAAAALRRLAERDDLYARLAAAAHRRASAAVPHFPFV